MKNILLLFFLFVPFMFFAQIANIPDGSFKHALINYYVVDLNDDGLGDVTVDSNNDGLIQISEAEAIDNLLLGDLINITSIEGIEYFINLRELDFSNCNVSSFDLSQNINLIELSCYGNPLVNNFDVSSNVNLEVLNCGNCQLGLLDVTKNVNLTHLDFGYNWISELDISQNKNLKSLGGYENNFVGIDVSQTPSLESLNLHDNPLQNLDVSANVALKSLNINTTSISEIDISQNLNLEWFNCSKTNISGIEASQNPELIRLFCTDMNSLTFLDIKNGGNTNLFNFLSSNNPLLECIQVDDVDYANSQLGDYWFIDSWTVFSEDCENLGVNNFETNRFTIYPNPVYNYLNIETTNNIDFIEIYDVTGKMVKHLSTTKKIEVSYLNKGIYFVAITIGENKIMKRFIKE